MPPEAGKTAVDTASFTTMSNAEWPSCCIVNGGDRSLGTGAIQSLICMWCLLKSFPALKGDSTGIVHA